MTPIFILTTLSFALQAAVTLKLSTDTLAVKFNTYFPYKMKMYKKTNKSIKYAHSFPATLANFVDFEFKFHEEILQLFDKYKASSETNGTDDFFIR